MSDAPGEPRPARQPWSDRWLLDAFRELGHHLAVNVSAAPSAWESLEAAGISANKISSVVCDTAGVLPVDLSSLEPESPELLSATLANRYDVVAVRLDGRTLEVATANPPRSNLERDLAFACARRIRVSVASPSAIRAARERIYAAAARASAAPRLTWA